MMCLPCYMGNFIIVLFRKRYKFKALFASNKEYIDIKNLKESELKEKLKFHIGRPYLRHVSSA